MHSMRNHKLYFLSIHPTILRAESTPFFEEPLTTHARTHTCTHARTHTCTHARTHTCTHTHTHTHATHMHTHTHTPPTRTHTHTHTHTCRHTIETCAIHAMYLSRTTGTRNTGGHFPYSGEQITHTPHRTAR